MQNFRGIIRKAGINPYVDVPVRVSRAFGTRGYVRVKVKLSADEVKSTLVPMGSGRHRLYINGIMLRVAKVEVGDSIAVELVIDEVSRMPAMPELLAKALAKRPELRQSWEALTPSKRKEFLSYLGHAKTEATLLRNVSKLLGMLDPQQVGGSLAGIKILRKIKRVAITKLKVRKNSLKK